MSFRNVAASLTLDITDYRAKLNEVWADTRRVVQQLSGAASSTGFDKLEADVVHLDRALRLVPDDARRAGSESASAFDRFGDELDRLDNQATHVARAQGQISEAAVEASRRAGGAYRTIGTEASSAAASARGSIGGLTAANSGLVVSAERAALAEGEIGLAAVTSGAEARGALTGVAGAHTSILTAAEEARLAEAGIGTSAISAAELAQRSALMTAEALDLITVSAERAALAQAAWGVAAERSGAQALAASKMGLAGGAGGGGVVPPVPRGGGSSNVAAAGEKGLLATAVAATHTVRSIAFTVAGFEGIIRMTRGLREAVTGASDLNESLSKTRFTFGASAPIVIGLAEEMRKRFGQSRTAILDAASGFGLIGKAASMADPEAAKMSVDLGRLAVDAQSFFNVPLPDVLASIQSGLVGEAEPMRRFGVLLDEASVKSHAYAMGIARVGQELTQAQKVQSRADLILNSPAMKTAMGDMERTSDQFANRMRIIGGRIKEWAVDVGTASIPQILHLVDVLEEAGHDAAPVVAAGFDKIGDALRAAGPFLSNMVEIGGDLWHILVDLAKAGAPIAGVLAAMGGGAVLAALTGLSSGLREVTGFLADHEEIVRVLAIAYGATLVPKIFAAVSAFAQLRAAELLFGGIKFAGGISEALGGIVSLGPAAVRSGAQVAAASGTSAASLRLVDTSAAAATIGLTETGTAGLLMGTKVESGATAAALSIGRLRIGLLGVGLVAGAAVVAAQHFFGIWQKEGQKRVTDRFGTDFLKTNNLQTLKNTREELRRERMRLEHELHEPPSKNATLDQMFQAEKGKQMPSLRPDNLGKLGSTIVEQAHLRDELRKTSSSYTDVDNKIKAITETRKKESEAVKQVAAQTGASARAVAQAMAAGGIKGDDVAGAAAAVTKLQNELDALAGQARISGTALASMFGDNQQAAIDFLKTVVDLGDKVRGAFLGDFDVTTHIDADPSKIKDAADQVAELRKGGKEIPLELTLHSQGPLEQLKSFYANAIKMGREFSDNARKALTLGFDPDLIQRLMLQGPEKAGPLLAALVSKSGASLVGMVNTQEAELRRQAGVIEEIATKQLIDQTIVQTLTTKAVEDQSGKRTATIGNAIKIQRAMLLIGEGATYDQVKMNTGLKTAEINAVVAAWGFKLFAGIDQVIVKFGSGTRFITEGVTRVGSPNAQGNIRDAQGRAVFAAGGHEDHTPTIAQGGPVRVWNEPELPWEGYVSGHPRYFNRSESIMVEIARRLGGRYLPKWTARKDDAQHFARGGLVDGRNATSRVEVPPPMLHNVTAQASGGLVAHLDRDTVRLADGAVVSRHEWAGGAGTSPRPARDRVEHFAAGGVRSSLVDRLRERIVGLFASGGVAGTSQAVRRGAGGKETGPRGDPRRAEGFAEGRTFFERPHYLAQFGIVSESAAGHVAMNDDSAPRTRVGPHRWSAAAGHPTMKPGAVVSPGNAVNGHGVVDRLGHASTVRRFAAGGIAAALPELPVKELAPYNITPAGAGRRGLTTTQVMRDRAVAELTRREEAVQRMKTAAAAQAASAGGSSGSAALPGAVQLWINTALGITSSPSSWFPALTTLVSRESGGNPRAINRTPVGRAREHAIGLFQMLPSTFRAHMLPGYGDVLNPIDNAVSALRYIAGRYGAPSRIPHLYDSKYQGYAKGGIVGRAVMLLASGGVVGATPARLALLEPDRALHVGLRQRSDRDPVAYDDVLAGQVAARDRRLIGGKREGQWGKGREVRRAGAEPPISAGDDQLVLGRFYLRTGGRTPGHIGSAHAASLGARLARASQGRASAASYSPREGGPRSHDRQGAPQNVAATAPPGRGATAAAPGSATSSFARLNERAVERYADGGLVDNRETHNQWNRTTASTSYSRPASTPSPTARSAGTGSPSSSTMTASLVGGRSPVASASPSTRRPAAVPSPAASDRRSGVARISGSAAGQGTVQARELGVVEVPRASVQVADRGGFVNPGWNLLFDGLGHRETVVPRDLERVVPPMTRGGGSGGVGAVMPKFDVQVNVEVGRIGGDVSLDDVKREARDAAEEGVKKAGERLLAGIGN